MRNNFLLLIVLVTSCTTDVPAPCEEDGPVGKLCREYRYSNDSPNGYVTYRYTGDSVLVSDFMDVNSKLKKTVTERFRNGRTSIVSEQFPQMPSRVQTWHYNELDSLWKIVYGANDSLLEISYEDGKRLREAYFHAGELTRFFEYRYYQDDGGLYRIYKYEKDSVLHSYRHFEYYSTGQNRVSLFTAQHELIGRWVYRSENGLLTSVQFTDGAGATTQRSDRMYDSAQNLIEKTEWKGGQTYKSVFLYY